MKLRQLINEVLDLKAITDTINNVENQIRGLKGQVPEIQKLQQDNLELQKKLEDQSKVSAAKVEQNKRGIGTSIKTGTSQNPRGLNAKATYQSTTPATGAPVPPQNM